MSDAFTEYMEIDLARKKGICYQVGNKVYCTTHGGKNWPMRKTKDGRLECPSHGCKLTLNPRPITPLGQQKVEE